MNNWLTTPENTKVNAYTQINEKTGIAVAAVEKDWWVVQVLATIFEMSVGKRILADCPFSSLVCRFCVSTGSFFAFVIALFFNNNNSDNFSSSALAFFRFLLGCPCSQAVS